MDLAYIFPISFNILSSQNINEKNESLTHTKTTTGISTSGSKFKYRCQREGPRTWVLPLNMSSLSFYVQTEMSKILFYTKLTYYTLHRREPKLLDPYILDPFIGPKSIKFPYKSIFYKQGFVDRSVGFHKETRGCFNMFNETKGRATLVLLGLFSYRFNQGFETAATLWGSFKSSEHFFKLNSNI